jgi:hypothetical protein
MNSEKYKHGYFTDPNGYHIIHKTEKSTAELIEEAKKLFSQQNKKEPEAPKQQPNTNEIKKLSRLHEKAFNY